MHDLKENQLISAEIELSNMNNSNVSPRKPDDSQRDFLMASPNQKRKQALPVVTNAARNPTNDDIICSTFTHVLSAFAIAEAQQDIFLRVKSYLILNEFELPPLNGIYNGSSFNEVRLVKTSYLHFLFSHALQVALHANWMAMAHSILIHCKDLRLSASVSKMDLSVLVASQNYDLMGLLIDYGAYFDRNERSIEAQ